MVIFDMLEQYIAMSNIICANMDTGCLQYEMQKDTGELLLNTPKKIYCVSRQ